MANKYSTEQRKRIKKHIGLKKPNKFLYKEFQKTFNITLSFTAFKSLLYAVKNGKTKAVENVWNKRILTQEQEDFIKEKVKEPFTKYSQIVEEFNKKFPSNKFKNQQSFRTYISKHKYETKGTRNYRTIKSAEELEYVKELMQDVSLTWRDIATKFEEKFNRKINHKRLQESMTKIFKVRRPKEIINSGKFTSERNRPRMSIGSEIEKDYYGVKYTWVKVADNRGKGKEDRNKIYKENWRPKQEVIWENYHHEKVGSNEIVIFLDGNNKNFDINNLKKITRATNATLSKYQAHNFGKSTEAMIDVIETNQILKGV